MPYCIQCLVVVVLVDNFKCFDQERQTQGGGLLGVGYDPLTLGGG